MMKKALVRSVKGAWSSVCRTNQYTFTARTPIVLVFNAGKQVLRLKNGGLQKRVSSWEWTRTILLQMQMSITSANDILNLKYHTTVILILFPLTSFFIFPPYSNHWCSCQQNQFLNQITNLLTSHMIRSSGEYLMSTD